MSATLICPGCSKPLVMREDRLSLLTPHKRRIAVMWTQGMRQKEIGATLRSTPHCIAVHLQQIYDVLPVSDQRELTLYLYGLIDAGNEQ